ncbi:MAG: glycoside hydrolase family 15 protein [bacterium]
MSSLKQQVKSLVKSSQRVLSDCALSNGAIVAANTGTACHPREAADYCCVWPRDAAFVIAAAPLIDLSIARPFFQWLDECPEDFKKEGLLYANYTPNGRLGSLKKMFEPDQAGTVLWAIDQHLNRHPDDLKTLKPLIERLANGLVGAWNGKYFIPNSADVWEDNLRMSSAKMENNFTYSIAACSKGLSLAQVRISNRKWKKTAGEMLKRVNEAWSDELGYFSRNHGKITDRNVDASLLGLVWPFELLPPDDDRIIKTVAKIENILVEHGGVHRYQYDYFDSEGTAWDGGGAWPLLNFWMSIYWSRRGNRKRALAYFQWVLERVDEFIPEQIFNDFRVGIYPLAWSHAMFLLAAQELKILN